MDDRPTDRNSKYDAVTKDLDLAGEYCQLEMYKNNKVISKHRSSAPPLLNGNSICDVNMMKKYITVFNESDRFEDQDLENLTLGSARNVAEQDFELQQSLPSKERRARRNVPGKRKSRAGTLCEIKLSSVENLDQTTEQLSSRQPLLANNRYTPMKTLDERKTLQLNNLVNSQLGAQQMSVCQEAPFETTDMDVPVTAPLGLDLHSKDLTPNDPFPCKPVTWENEVSIAQTIGRDGEAWTSFPTTPGDRAITSKIDSENTANRYQDDLMNVTKEQSNSCVTKTPSPLLDISVNAANHWEMTEEMFSLNSAGKLSAGRKRFSRRASSVGARGSPETNSLICYIANQKMQESQRVSMLRRKMEAFMGTFQAAEQDENKTSTPELPHLSGLWQTGSTPAKEQDSTLSASCSKPAQKKKVTFGEELSPELFDERLPSNTPLRRGETPVYQKITFSDGLPSALKQRSKTHIALEEEKSTSGDVTCNGCSPENDHGDSTSIKLQAKFENDMEISATGTQNDDEDRCCPIPINFEIESPLSECKVGPDNQKSCNRNDEYPCEVLDVKIQELNEILPLTISPSGHPGERSNIRKDNVTICRNLTKKKTDCISKKLSKVKPELDKKIAAINKLKTSEMETESGVESDMDHMPCILNEMSKTGDGFLDHKNTDLSMNDGVQANFIGDTCPNIQNLSEQRDETDDKKVCSEALSADVSPNPTTKSQEEMKTRNEEQESKKEEPRRSARIKQNVLKNSTTATKGKRRQKFKKDLYGKREYASRKPLLSPIAEVLDIWSESEVLPDSDVMLECEPSRRTSLIYLEA
ncbi:cell division cycle-associated protein 2 [Pristis pectinata]|uniref:cell division cycle-associated protein 2 n=1 Tax=Pristis pectinata TaxID=685728 RepID=UPI00223CD2A1|nr:cell division cycle-associated protein 2 [Pristis pectinata]